MANNKKYTAKDYLSDAYDVVTRNGVRALTGFDTAGEHKGPISNKLREIRDNLVPASARQPKPYTGNTVRDVVQGIDRRINSAGKKMGLPGFKHGGKVKNTGPAKVHKGEVVLPKKVVRKMSYAQVRKSVRKTMGYK